MISLFRPYNSVWLQREETGALVIKIDNFRILEPYKCDIITFMRCNLHPFRLGEPCTRLSAAIFRRDKPA